MRRVPGERVVSTTSRLHDVPFVARGAGTGLSGGATPSEGGLVISLTSMNEILELDVNPIRPPHNGLALAFMPYLQVLLAHRPSTHGAEGSHLLEDSLPLFFQSARSIHDDLLLLYIYNNITAKKRSTSKNPLL